MHPNETTLNDYVDGALGPAERGGVDQHLAGCAVCRRTVEDLRDILAATRELDLREPPVRAWARLERAIKLEQEHAAAGARLPLDAARGKPLSGSGAAKAGRDRTYVTWLAAAA